MGINFQPKPILSSTLFVLLLFSIPIAYAKNTTSVTAYDVLQQYNFRSGLLPRGVVGYELDRSSGKFKAYLGDTCTFHLDSYELKYRSTITGVIGKDKISDLEGIEVKVVFPWLNIVGVIRDEDELHFSVGIASADFAVSNFYENPTCGCGFDCDRVGLGRESCEKVP